MLQSPNEIKNVKSISGCVGCGLCADVCALHAITMRHNQNGFIVPHIDEDVCINCGLCVKKCVVGINDKRKTGQEMQPGLYAARNTNNDTLKRSSSGGVFFAVAELFINQSGCVFGVKWRDKYTAEFTMVETKPEIAALQGSKYIQAFPEHVYQKVKIELQKGRPVLFSGTSCQVYALYRFLGKKYDNLFTIDIVCHGAPSHNAFRLYIDEVEAESCKTVSHVDFRDKKNGWHNFSCARHTSDGEVSYVCHREDDFMRLFLSNKILNDTCYECPFTKYGRQGDLSLGDFWRVGKYFPKWDARLGISVVLANSKKGLDMLRDLEGAKLQLVPITQEMAEQGYTIRFDGQTKLDKPDDRDYVLDKLKHADNLSSVVSETLGHRPVSAVSYGEKNVALFGFWYGFNYGAQLTSLALYRQLEQLGWRPTLVAVPNVRDWENRFLRSKGVRFTPQLDTYEDYLALNKHFAGFVIGSDQLWRYQYASRLGHLYYLNFVSAGKRRVSYGTSLGTNPCLSTEEYRKEASFLLRFFAGVSSREREGVEVLKKQYNTEAEYVLDPVFLCSTDTYRQWAADSRRVLPESDYVCSYIMDPDDGSLQELITYISKRENADMINMLDATNFEKVRKSLTLENIVENLSTEDWLYYIINCKHFITNSFHGLCFALMFNKPFTVVGNELRGNSRFTSILNEFGMKEYLLATPKDIKRVEKLPPVNWWLINEKLRTERARSEAWLKSVMEMPLKHDLHETEELYQRHYILTQKLDSLSKLYTEVNERSKMISSGWAVSNSHDDLALIFSFNIIRRKYYRYCLLSKITFGKKRKRYKQKREIYHDLLRNARNARRRFRRFSDISI